MPISLVVLLITLLIGGPVYSDETGQAIPDIAKDNFCKPHKEFYKDRERGWYYREYCHKTLPIKKKKEGQKERKAEDESIDWARIQDTKYLDTLDAERFRKLFDRVKDEVVYNPTKDKLLAYLRMQDYMREKSLKFAYIWRDVLLEHPELDQTVKYPASNYGTQARYSIVAKEQRMLMAEMSETVGLFFFVSAECPYCHEQSKIIDMLMADYGVTVRTISSDYCAEPFKFCTVAPELFETFNVKVTPTLVAVFKDANNKPIFQPIASGIVTLDDIVNRLVFYYKYIKTGEYGDV